MLEDNFFIKQAMIAKLAAMTATNDQDVEKAFSDQASGFVENRVGDLMKDQYRIGFEVVKKNDDNTRMVGIFAFKVDKDLIYAPVFFLNGEIKGPLLYRANTKTFVPANKEWASYLIESMEMSDGKGRDRTRRVDSAPLVRMRDIAFRPPGMHKGASSECNCCEDCKCEHIVGAKAVLNLPAEQKKIEAPTPDMTGAYEIKGLSKPDGKQPKLNNGESFFKVATWEDGTVRFETKDGFVPMTQEEAIALRKAASENGVTLNIEGTVCEFSKEAATNIVELIDTYDDSATKWLGNMLEKISASQETGLIREFLTEPDFGKPAADAILKAAASHYEFANTLAGIYGEAENFIPASFSTSAVKQASNAGELAIYYDANELAKSEGVTESEISEFFKSGAVIHDTRTENLSVVYDNTPEALSAPDSPGVYDLLGSDGEFVKNVFVAQMKEGNMGAQSEYGKSYGDACCYSSEFYDITGKSRPAYIAVKDGKVYRSDELIGIKVKTAKDADVLKKSPSAHSMYYIYLEGCDSLVGPVAIESVKTVGGVKHCRAYYSISRYCSPCGFYESETKPLIVNPDLEQSDVSRAVFGKDAKFLEVNIKPERHKSISELWRTGGSFDVADLEGIGASASLDNWIFNQWNTPKVIVEKTMNQEKNASTYCIRSGDFKSDVMHRTVAMVKLARDLSIPADKAYEILNKADSNGSTSFYLEQAEKSASRLHLVDRPNFDEEFDSEFGIPLVPEKKFVLRVQGDQIFEQPSAIGDALNPTSLTGLPDLTVATTDPADLRELADTYHLPNVFEHGVVGTLANTFNANYLVDKYLPKVEDGVDALGRIKFLLHWCPGDFERSYGMDDMANFEAEIDSNFEALGSLHLKLLKKSDKQKKNQDKNEEEKAQ